MKMRNTSREGSESRITNDEWRNRFRTRNSSIGLTIKGGGDSGDTGDTGDTFRKYHFILNLTITRAAQGIAEINDLDIDVDQINSQRIANVFKKDEVRKS